jgi:hypothetical protein
VLGIHAISIALLDIARVADPSASSPTARIESIVLPSHHLDKPGDVPKCKGFALITFSRAEDAEALLAAWPWSSADSKHESSSAPVQDCIKSGFRCMLKREWDRRKEEYLIHRQQILDQIATTDSRQAERQTAALAEAPNDNSDAYVYSTPVAGMKAKPANPATQLWSPYPRDCLVFVRHVHPQTNKTTLRTLFSAAFKQADSQESSKDPNECIDYVDFTKGMDTVCIVLSHRVSNQ